METQISQAAKRFNAIVNLLKYASSPLTQKQIYEAPSVKDLCKGEYSVPDTLLSLRNAGYVRRVPSSDSKAQYMYELVDKEATPTPPVWGSNKPKANKEVPAKPAVKVNNISGDILLPEITVTRTGVLVQTDKFKLTIEL